MCRWVAYSGSPVFIEQLVTKPTHSLVEQSLNTKMNYKEDGSLWATNGDGYGLAWYGERRENPGLFKGERPAWNDINLHEICAQVKTGLFFAHIRAATTGVVQRTNSHPFKYKNWIFQHNGHIDCFEIIRKDLQMEIAGKYFYELKGTTDSETFFLLALSYGLEDNPKEALKKAVRRIEIASRDRKIEFDVNLSCAISDGDRIYTLRYANKDKPKTQFYSTNAESMLDINQNCFDLPERSVIVVSEPLDTLSDKWDEAPPNTFSVIEDNKVTTETFI